MAARPDSEAVPHIIIQNESFVSFWILHGTRFFGLSAFPQKKKGLFFALESTKERAPKKADGAFFARAQGKRQGPC